MLMNFTVSLPTTLSKILILLPMGVFDSNKLLLDQNLSLALCQVLCTGNVWYMKSFFRGAWKGRGR